MKTLHIVCLAGLLWLTGCATNGSTSASLQTDAQPPDRPTRTHTPIIPNGPLSPITAGSASSSEVASLSTPADLWERIRRGFAMPELQGDLVQDREKWYATRPDYIQRMTERSSKYLFHIVEELERRGMPTELALLPYIESAFNPRAVSSAKAAGMWQFMPATGNYFDLKQNAFRDDRRDVLASTRAALDYLQKLYGMFGDWHLALAAYNWGEGSVGRSMARNQKTGLGTSYTELNMPNETRMYVPKLQALKNIVANPEAFRVELPPIDNHPYFQTVDITHDIDVAAVAQLAGVREEDFRALNPSFHRPTIFAAGTPQILLPWDNARVFQRNLEAQNQGQFASWTVWSVPSTMSVAEAAQRVGMNESELRSVNNIPPRMLIKSGSALMVPRTTTRSQDVSAHLADNGQVALAPEIITRRALVRASKHDTVQSIAQRFKVSADQIAQWNGIKANAALKAGQQLVLMLPARMNQGPAAERPLHFKVDKNAPAPARKGGTPSRKKR